MRDLEAYRLAADKRICEHANQVADLTTERDALKAERDRLQAKIDAAIEINKLKLGLL